MVRLSNRIYIQGAYRSGIDVTLGRAMRETNEMRLLPILAVVLTTLPSFAQSEAALRGYFEGRYVRSRIDLPATHDGLDIHYRRDPPIDIRTQQRRMNEWGPAVQSGAEVAVTLVKVKGKNIEFQLAGGGLNESSSVSFSTYVPKSSRESRLEREVRDEKDSRRRDSLRRELDRLRDSRSREERLLRMEKERLEAMKLRELHEKAYRYGSRINIWFPDNYLKESIPTPEDLMRMLDEYVDFSPMNRGGSRPAAQPSNPSPAPSVSGLKRGMETDAVHKLLGNPDRYKDTREGTLALRTEAWDFSSETVEVDYAEGVVLRWRVFSK